MYFLQEATEWTLIDITLKCHRQIKIFLSEPASKHVKQVQLSTLLSKDDHAYITATLSCSVSCLQADLINHLYLISIVDVR